MSEFIKYPEPGRIYQHYKGGKYEVITMATHSETQEPLVIYKSFYFGSTHARPLKMWFEEIKKEGTISIYRFTEIDE